MYDLNIDQLMVLRWQNIARHALLRQHLEKSGLRQLRPLKELHCFCTADKTVPIFISHSKPVVKQVNISHLTDVCQSIQQLELDSLLAATTGKLTRDHAADPNVVRNAANVPDVARAGVRVH